MHVQRYNGSIENEMERNQIESNSPIGCVFVCVCKHETGTDHSSTVCVVGKRAVEAVDDRSSVDAQSTYKREREKMQLRQHNK